jgi:hypothetical protein
MAADIPSWSTHGTPSDASNFWISVGVIDAAAGAT